MVPVQNDQPAGGLGDRLVQISDESPHHDPSDEHHGIRCHRTAGQVDRALDIFERRFQLGDAYMDWIDNDADFDSIRDHPRFRRMIGRD